MPVQTKNRREKPDRKSRSYRRGDIQYLDERELGRLFAAIDRAGNVMHMALFHVALNRGLRASEVGLLQFDRLHLGARTLFVERLKSGNSGEFPLTDPEVLWLGRWKKLCGRDTGPIFLSRHNRAISRRRLDQLMKMYGASAAIPIPKRHFHTLRHSAGTLRGEQGDVAEIMDLLGHRDPKSTLVYLKIRDKRRAQIGERWHAGILPGK